MLRTPLHHLSQSGLALAAYLGLAFCVAPARAQMLPPDATPLCAVPDATFATWFQSGAPSRDGAVKPASSVSFPGDPDCNCGFYEWALQMFFWLTSPAASAGNGGRTIDTGLFYDVSAPDPNNHNLRTLREHKPGILPQLSVRNAQLGPRGLPVIFSKTGQMLEIERPQVTVNAQLNIRKTGGERVEVAHAGRSATGALVLTDSAGRIIEPDIPAPGESSLRGQTTGSILVQRFLVDGVPIYIDLFGNILDIGPGEVQGGVLQAQNGSLIYYGIMVNDVYAVFQAGVQHHVIAGPTFPTDLDAITSYAAMKGIVLADADALAIEIKTAWIEADKLPNPGDYITVEATVPTYDTKTDPMDWKPNGTKPAKLALIGMHVVGSTRGHPEMIWATFEHFGNTPNDAYSYFDSSVTTKPVPQDTGGTWLFSKSGATEPFNEAHMAMSGNDVQVSDTSPSNTIRRKAWGAASDIPPNSNAESAARSNTEIIAINNSVQSKMMMKGDMRNNYFLLGATWTKGGGAPRPPFGAPTRANFGNQVGTSQLANSTMETYQQGTDTTSSSGGTNCFSCHSSSDWTTATTFMSHIFDSIVPLF